MFDALAKLSASIPDAYQQASEFGDLHVGDLHLIRINGQLLCSLFLILDCNNQICFVLFKDTQAHFRSCSGTDDRNLLTMFNPCKQCSRPTGCVLNLLIEKLNP